MIYLFTDFSDSTKRITTEGDSDSSASPVARDVKVTPVRPKAPETVHPTPESPQKGR